MSSRDDFRKPERCADWKVLILFVLLSFTVAFGLRAMELPKWDNPAFMVDGEYILGTHDAYAWLAGAKGIGNAATNPMSGMIKFLGSVSGVQYGNIAFWLPAFFAGFTAVAAFAWGALLGGAWTGLCAGVFATSIPMFYFRTRLSYYDTDLVTLLFPLVISFLIAHWVSRGTRKKWLPGEIKTEPYQRSVWEYAVPVLSGLCVAFGRQWHSDVFLFGLYSIFAALFLVLVCGSKESRPVLLRGLVYFCLAAMFGWIGGILAVLLIIVLFKSDLKENHILDNIYLYIVAILAVLLVSDAGNQFILFGQKFVSYLKPVSNAVEQSTTQIHYPGIAQSVIEAQNISFKALISDLTGNMYLSGFGFIGFAFLLLCRPTALLLLPFALMSIAAMKLGGRFAMFGGIVLGLGGCEFLLWLITRFLTFGKKKKACAALASISLVSLLLVGVLPQYNRVAPTPIIYQEHAKALKALDGATPKDSTFWTWWDWGYVTMYYTGRHSFADGSNHGGSTLFPLAFAYTTSSLKQANQFLKYCAQYKGGPANVWRDMPVEEVTRLVYSFGHKDYGFNSSPKQYIVTSWSDVRLAYWILYYGSCNLMTGQGIHPNVSALSTGFNLDKNAGRISFNNGQVYSLSGYDLISQQIAESKFFPDSVGPYLLFNQYANQGYMVDEMVRNSLLAKLMLMNPSSPEIKGRFKLVYEGFPMVRIYEVI